MKRFLCLILILSFVISMTACAGASVDEKMNFDTETTTQFQTSDNETLTTETTTDDTTTSYTDTTDTTETTMTQQIFGGYITYESTTEMTTTVNHPCGGTGDCPSEETTETTETTNYVDRYELGMEYVRTYAAYIVTDGDSYQPYTSSIYYQNPYMTGDGILMFVSMENQLPYWIEDGVIPYVALSEDSYVLFDYHEDAELQHTGKFRIYVQDEGGRFYQAAELLQSDLQEVYAWGKENLAGKTVYISYPFLLRYGDYSDLPDAIWSNCAVHDIMCVFTTTF